MTDQRNLQSAIQNLQNAIQTAIEKAMFVDNLTPEQVNKVLRRLTGSPTLAEISCDECGSVRSMNRMKFEKIGKVWVCDICHG